MYTTTVRLGRRVEQENGKNKVVKDGTAFKVLRFSSLDLKDPAKTLATWVKALHDAGLEAPLIIEDFTPNVPGADRLRKSAAFMHTVLASLATGA